MTLEEFKQTDWYQERPEVIQKAIDIIPPTELYRFKDSQKECQIIGYTEPKKGSNPEDVTLIVQKTGEGGPLASMSKTLAAAIDRNPVFGVAITDLEVVPIKTE